MAHEPSLVERGLLDRKLIDLVELQDEDEFFREIEECDNVLIL
jgi:tRNA 2-thiouridine synthesizing protein C